MGGTDYVPVHKAQKREELPLPVTGYKTGSNFRYTIFGNKTTMELGFRRNRYPTIALMRDLKNDGIETMGYINPFPFL